MHSHMMSGFSSDGVFLHQLVIITVVFLIRCIIFPLYFSLVYQYLYQRLLSQTMLFRV